MNYLVDTDWLIDVLSGIESASTALQRLSSDGVGVSIITVGELYEGAVLSPESAAALRRYRDFLAAFPVVPLSDPIMYRFATIRAHLRQAGNLIPDLDLLIAATALEHDLTLITRNVRPLPAHRRLNSSSNHLVVCHGRIARWERGGCRMRQREPPAPCGPGGSGSRSWADLTPFVATWSG